MKLLKLLLMFSAIFSLNFARITKKHSFALKAICIKMVQHIFPDNYCLYYISDTAITEVPFVIYCLKNLNTSLVLVNPEGGTYQSLPSRKQIPCDGYLIVSANYKALKKFFTYRYEGSFEFQTHKKILVLFVGEGNFMVPPFSTVANLKGNDIIVIDKLPNYQRDLEQFIIFYQNGRIVREGDIVDMNVTIRASSVRENKVLKEWRYLVEDFDETLINFTPWTPNFQRENDTFKVACFDCTPYVYVNHKNEAFDGIDYQIIKLITYDWPVTFQVSNFSVNNDMYLKTVTAVQAGQTDLGACSIWLRTMVSFKVDMTIAYSEVCSTFLVPKPQIVKPTWLVFHPMNNIVWILVGIITIIVAILIKLAPKSNEEDYNNFTYALIQSIRVLALGPLNRFPIKPHFVFKMVLVIWLYTSLILTTGYNAGFSSVLTYLTYTAEIKTIDDMIEQGIRWGGLNTGIRDNLISSGDPGVVKLVDNFMLEKDIRTKNMRILSNKYAVVVKTVANKYVTDTSFLEDYARKNLKVLEECYASNSLIYVLKMNSPHKEILDRRLLRVTEHGFMQFWTNRILNQYNMSYMRQFYMQFDDVTIAYEPLNLAKLGGIFYFLIIGYCTSIIVFIGEYRYDLYKKNTYLVYSPRLRVQK